MLLKSMIEYLSQTSNLSIENLIDTVGSYNHHQIWIFDRGFNANAVRSEKWMLLTGVKTASNRTTPRQSHAVSEHACTIIYNYIILWTRRYTNRFIKQCPLVGLSLAIDNGKTLIKETVNVTKSTCWHSKIWSEIHISLRLTGGRVTLTFDRLMLFETACSHPSDLFKDKRDQVSFSQPPYWTRLWPAIREEIFLITTDALLLVLNIFTTSSIYI